MPSKKKVIAEDQPDRLNELLDEIDSLDDGGANGRKIAALKAKSKELREPLQTTEETTEAL